MARTNLSEPAAAETGENPRILGLAGSLLFSLGLVAAFLVFVQDASADRVRMVLNAAILLSLGFPTLMYARALRKIAALEQRIAALEQRSL